MGPQDDFDKDYDDFEDEMVEKSPYPPKKDEDKK